MEAGGTRTLRRRPDHGMLGKFIPGLSRISHGLCEALDLLNVSGMWSKQRPWPLVWVQFSIATLGSSSLINSTGQHFWYSSLPGFFKNVYFLNLVLPEKKTCIQFEWNWICFRAQAACLLSEAKWRWISIRCSHYNLSPPVVFIKNC